MKDSKVKKTILDFLERDKKVKEELKQLDWNIDELSSEITEIILDGKDDFSKELIIDVLYDLIEAGK